MNKKRFIVSVIIALVLILLAVCLLPWPASIDMKLSGVLIDANGGIEAETDVTVTGWKLNYLFRSDKQYITVEMSDELGFRHVSSDSGYPVLDYSQVIGDVPYTVLPSVFYLTSFNSMRSSCMALSIEDGMILIESPLKEGAYVVASVAPDTDPAEILEYFDAFLTHFK